MGQGRPRVSSSRLGNPTPLIALFEEHGQDGPWHERVSPAVLPPVPLQFPKALQSSEETR